ncbi:NAD(P)/FAD-dependent oxidoreductase [Dongia rigui]|uniref:NAD(P)/FAD-dependent oxidoreductase n=1 Tax=Dongia rigui TaxID=940149 RepID=A0ABU5E192_9PROT|nr:NAD(P)/FAD-dependent oxidoreductase [Dongia rigui]MDY0873353.1 NAD(P)/FAD-dependent oxidoreductase [Dongia rigui]
MLDFMVIGAGVIGLAIARRLARAGHEVVIVDTADAIGSETSSRNSEVIHAGIYYPTGSLKAQLCVSGRKALYRYCAARAVPHRQCGKLIVASDDGQRAALQALAEKALANGVEDLQVLSVGAARSLEPALNCVAALLSPSTGIVDSQQLMLSYLGEAENAGAVLSLRTPVVRGMHKGNRWLIGLGGSQPDDIPVRTVINAAGLEASRVARSLGLAPDRVPTTHYAKGNYFTLQGGKPPFSRLIYPLPEPGGLGVHVTLDLAGRVRFGPDVEWVEAIDYAVDAGRAERFYPAIRRYYPEMADATLVPAYSGIRPKLSRDPRVDSDFRIETEADHGAPGLVCLYGIESPGLTASLALAERIASGLGVLPTQEDAELFHV